VPDHVVYAGSLSKSLVPGLRLSWLVVPSALRDELIAARGVTDRFTPSITQATAAEFLQRGDLDRHLRRTHRNYRQRHDTLISALQRQLPGIHATGISAGLHVVVQLPDGMDAAHIAATAARHGILLTPSTTTGPTMNGPVPLPWSSATAGSRPPDRGRHPPPRQHHLNRQVSDVPGFGPSHARCRTHSRDLR